MVLRSLIISIHSQVQVQNPKAQNCILMEVQLDLILSSSFGKTDLARVCGLFHVANSILGEGQKGIMNIYINHHNPIHVGLQS